MIFSYLKSSMHFMLKHSLLFLGSLACIALLYTLLLSEHGLRESYRLKYALKQQTAAIQGYQKKHEKQYDELSSIKSGQKRLEEVAREKLGMIGEGERYIPLD